MMAEVIGASRLDALGDFTEVAYDTGVKVIYYLYWPIVVSLPGEGYVGRPDTFSKHTQAALGRHLPEGAVIAEITDVEMLALVKGESRGRYRRKLDWGVDDEGDNKA